MGLVTNDARIDNNVNATSVKQGNSTTGNGHTQTLRGWVKRVEDKRKVVDELNGESNQK